VYLLKQYQEHGKNGISTPRYYTEEYELSVIKCHYEDGETIMDLVQETGIQCRMIKEWLNCYAREGYAGLITLKCVKPKAAEPKTDAERIRRLEMENEVLRPFPETCEGWDAKK